MTTAAAMASCEGGDMETPLPAVSVKVKPNARRAAFLMEEALAAQVAARPDVADFLKERALGWMAGQKE